MNLETSDTLRKLFHTEPGKASKTKFMKLSKWYHFNTYVDDDLTMVGIPYDDGMTMTLLMPKLGELSNFEVKFSDFFVQSDDFITFFL